MNVAEAKAALLRALDELDAAERDLGREPDRVDLVVVYALGAQINDGWQHITGWACTPGPKWAHAALLRRAADAHDEAAISEDTEPDDGSPD